MIQSRVTRDQSEVRLEVCGRGPMEKQQILHPADLSGSHTHLRFEEVVFSIETGTKLSLWWEGEGYIRLLLPLEGRGNLQYDRLGGIVDPKGPEGGGVSLLVEGDGLFSLILEFAKQRGA